MSEKCEHCGDYVDRARLISFKDRCGSCGRSIKNNNSIKAPRKSGYLPKSFGSYMWDVLTKD